MTAPAIPLSLADSMGDARIAATGLILAIRGALLGREEKDALAAMACALEDRLIFLADEIEALRATEAKPEGGE